MTEENTNEFFGEIDGSGELVWVNETDHSDTAITQAVAKQYPELGKLTRWMSSYEGNSRKGGLFSQNKYVSPESIFGEFRVAYDAARSDDVISNALDTTENLAFKRARIDSLNDDPDADDIDVWNQITDDINLVRKMREIWRELFIVSQCYPAVAWTRKTYRPHTLTESGKKSKKSYNLVVPRGITLLDPLKVVPMGNFMFGQEDLVYIADPSEKQRINDSLVGPNSTDMVVSQLITDRYEASQEELADLRKITKDKGVTIMEDSLYLLNPDNVWRITLTRPDYQRFADVRLRSVFELLDLKHNLREMDRADILGNLNAIILVKKGSKERPGQPAELAQAAAQVQQSSRLPIIVSDERLEIEIITRKTDHTLRPERYNMIDSRIAGRVYQALVTGSYNLGTATDSSINLFKIIASSMQARRDNIRESIQDKVIDEIYNRNPKLTEMPQLAFSPSRVAIEFDPHFTQFVYDLFLQGQVSHETVLGEVDISLETEAVKKAREKSMYGDIFPDVVVPGSARSTGDPKADGRIGGGNNNGGGSNQDSFDYKGTGPKDSKTAE